MSEELKSWQKPHGHTEQEVKAAGGSDGCPVCLRARVERMEKVVVAAQRFRNRACLWANPKMSKADAAIRAEDANALDDALASLTPEKAKTECSGWDCARGKECPKCDGEAKR